MSEENESEFTIEKMEQAFAAMDAQHPQVTSPPLISPLNAAILLLADIRRAVGDAEGKLMQDELVAHCGELLKRAGMYDRLNESLAKNKRMFSDELAQRLIESQTKRIQQLENELIETKHQLRVANEKAP